MTRIAFTSDWHVDEYGTRIDPESGLSARLVDYLRTAEYVASEARRREVAALVIAGDLSERRHPSPWLVARIQDAITHGPDRVIVTRGNHDGAKGGRWIGNILAHHDGWEAVDRPQVIPLEDGAICALGYLDRHFLRSLEGFESVPDADLFRILGEQFVAIAAGLYAQATEAGAKWTVLVCHATLAGAQMSETQQAFLGDLGLVVDARALQAIGFEAVVAGHLHRHQVVLPGDRPVLYAGSIERVDFGEELEAKGFIVADVAPGRFDWEFVETPARRFITVDAGPDGKELGTLEQFEGAIVRVVSWPADRDPSEIRRLLEAAGAFEITEIRIKRPEAPEAAGGMSESLSAEQALEVYFAGEPDAEVLVELGRGILEAVR